MPYTKQTWAIGDVVTADKMNHIENGIAANDTAIGTTNAAITAAGPMILTFPTEPTSTDNSNDYYEETHGYTWQNVVDAINSGRNVLVLTNQTDGDGFETTVSISTGFSYFAEPFFF